MSYTDHIECPHCRRVIELEVDIDYNGLDDIQAVIKPLPTQDICPECLGLRPGDERVRAGMKCSVCAGEWMPTIMVCEDCQTDRDYCCDCNEGDLYKSPDLPGKEPYDTGRVPAL